MKIFSIIIFFPCFLLYSQDDLEKALKKMKLKKNNLIVSNENIPLFPNEVIYNFNNVDSIIYLGCLSANRDDFKNFFEKGEAVNQIPIGSMIIRATGINSFDTVYIHSIDHIKNNIITNSNINISELIDSNAEYLLVFYWSVSTFDKYILKNYNFYKKYISKHPELNIQLLPILVE